MAPLPTTSVTTHVASLTDPRVARTNRHALLEILTLALCAVIGGADAWVEVERRGHAKQAWLRTFLALPNGIPWHDTVGRVCTRLDPAACQRCCLTWVRAVAGEPATQVAAPTARRRGPC